MRPPAYPLWFILVLLGVAGPVAAKNPDGQARARVQELNRQVEKAYQRGDYRAGLERAKKTYEDAKQSLSAEDADTLTSLHNLAELYQAEGHYREAESHFQKALQLREKVLGSEHPDTLASLDNLAVLYRAQDRYGEAEPMHQKALQLREKVLGPEHPDTLLSLSNLAALYQDQSRYGEAEPLVQKALQLREKVLGPEHPDTVRSLHNLATLYQAQRRYGEAEPLYQKALRLKEKVLGPEHPDTLASLHNLALLYQGQRRYGEAEPLHQKALQLSEKVLGPEHPTTMTNLYSLAILYQAQGRHGEAEPLFQKALQLSEKVLGLEHPDTLRSLALLYWTQGRDGEAKKALQLREKMLGPEHPDTLRNLDNQAKLYQDQGRYGEAEPLFQKALRLSEKVLGPEHPDTLRSLNNLAVLYWAQGRYGEAEPLHQKALQLSEKVLGPEHPDTLISLDNLATLYRAQGRYREAEPLLQKALRLSEKVLGPEHPDTLRRLNNLALLYHVQRRYGEAEPLIQKALRLSEKVLGPEHPDTLMSLDNLARLYEAQRRYGEAEPLLQKVLRLSEKVLGPEDPDTLISLNRLAGLYWAQRRYGEAEPLIQKALRLSEKVLGPEHPDTLMSLGNLATLYQTQGRYGEAEPLHQKALQLSEKVLGPEHPLTLGSLNDLAALYQDQGRYGEAEPLVQKALQLREKVLGPEHPDTLKVRLNLVILQVNRNLISEALAELQRMEPQLLRHAGTELYATEHARVRRALLLSLSSFQDVVLTLALRHPSPEAVRLGADVVLHWKQVMREQEAFLAALVRSSEDPHIRSLAGQLAALHARLPVLYQAELAGTLKEREQTEPAGKLKETLKELEQKELELAQASRSYATYLQTQRAGIEQVQRVLPPKSALLEIKQYRPADFKRGRFEKPHWAGLLVRADEAPRMVDLGPVKESNVWRAELEHAKDPVRAKVPAARLYKSLFGQLDEQLRGIETLYLAPDKDLHLLPFDRLVLPDGRYWVERQSLRLLQTGRDLLRPPQTPASDTLLALGGVDFDFPSPTKREAMVVASDFRKANANALDALSHFVPLNASGPEAEKIARLYQEARKGPAELWTAGEAREARLKSLAPAPRILHLSTHGFYLDAGHGVEQPLSLSGVALTGANRGLKGEMTLDGEDGILYGLEAVGLNLQRTELVTLSACDTGKGAVDYSEGVYSLARAFRIAGAQSVLMTLWSVDDNEAKDFMVSFYTEWFSQPHSDPAAALQATKRAYLHHENLALRDPRVWAPYVLVGR